MHRCSNPKVLVNNNVRIMDYKDPAPEGVEETWWTHLGYMYVHEEWRMGTKPKGCVLTEITTTSTTIYMCVIIIMLCHIKL